MTHCRHLTPSLTCSDPSQPAAQRGIRCSWRGDCDRERPVEVMQQIAREGVGISAALAPGTKSPVRMQVQAARERLAAAIKSKQMGKMSR